MKPDAFERDIRKVLEEVDYRPSEASWQKMQQALKEGNNATFAPGKSSNTAKKVPFWSISRSVAAACIGVVATAALLLYVNQTEVNSPAQLVNKENNTSPSAPSHKVIAQAVPPAAENNTASLQPQRPLMVQGSGARSTTVNISSDYTAASLQHTFTERIGGGLLATTISPVMSSTAGSLPEMRSALAPVSAVAERNERFKIAEDMGSKLYSASDWSDNPEHNATFEDPFIYGLSVKGGLPTVGLMQFNAGMTVKRDWNKRMYTEANLDVSYTDVRYKKALYYRKNDNGSFTNLGDNLSNSLTAASGSTTNTYGNHVIGVGLAAMAGYNVTNNISVAVGADMYRNFNNKLVLEDDNPLVKGTTLKNTVNPLKWINVWDAGARAQIRYRVSDYVAVVAQYRQGLVNYMADDVGKKIKNTSVGLGVNVSLNP